MSKKSAETAFCTKVHSTEETFVAAPTYADDSRCYKERIHEHGDTAKVKPSL